MLVTLHGFEWRRRAVEGRGVTAAEDLTNERRNVDRRMADKQWT